MTPSVDPAALENLWGLTGEGGGDLAAELITLFAEQTRAIVAALQRPAPQQDCHEARRLAHRLAGSALTLGANGIAAIARQIEDLAEAHHAEEIPALAAQLAELFEPTLDRLRAERDALMRRSAQSS